MNLWIPDRADRDAVGELPESVVLGLLPLDGPLPDAVLDAEFLVPVAGDLRVAELLGRMSALRVIQTLSAGVEWLLEVVPAEVTLCDASGARDGAVSEWVLSSILALMKMLPQAYECQREHRWQWRRCGSLDGRTVMILGYGSIGQALEARLAPFDIELIRVAARARPGVHGVEDLDALLPRVEVLVVLLPLTEQTRGLLDGERLNLLPDGALLINGARGEILDTEALVSLLHEQRMRAALDVTDPEPLPEEHPLWDAPGVLITPHLAGDTRAAERRAFAFVGEQVRRHVQAQPLENIVAQGY